MKLPFAAVALILLFQSGTVQAQQTDSRIGEQVFTRSGTVLRAGEDAASEEVRATPADGSGVERGLSPLYKVEQVQGDWLRLQDERGRSVGWARARDILTGGQAVDHFSDQLRAAPRAPLYTDRGLARFLSQGPGEAIADFNEAIRLDPKYAPGYYNRGRAWKATGDLGKAMADYNRAIRLAPGYAMAFVRRGDVWDDRRDEAKAIADYSKAIQIDPKCALAYSNRGLIWHGKGDYQKAVADYDRAIRLSPWFSPAYNNRGNSLTQQGQYAKAIADYNKALQLKPGYALGYLNRGVVWVLKKDFEKALADYNEAVRFNPELALAYSNRAWLWATCPQQKFRDGKKAVESATKACELTGWKNAKRLSTLAAAYAEVGDFGKAVELQEKANVLYTDADGRKDGEELLGVFKSGRPYRES